MILSPEQAAGVLLERRSARKDLVTYASRVPVPGTPIKDSDDTGPIPLIETEQAEHHKLFLTAMQRCMETPGGRLMIMAPPGSAKSTYVTVVGPSWYLGMHPGKRVILSSHSEDLAVQHGRRTRQLLRSPESTSILQAGISEDTRAADSFNLTNGSEYRAFPILGGATGNRADGLVIDDPIKGRADSDSATIRNRTYAAYTDDLLTRLKPNGWVVLINTRWHEDDLSGRILPEGWAGESGDILCRDGNVWNVVCLQAECATDSDPLGREIGDMLWPEWFNDRHWAQFRSNVSTWSSLFQQLPAPLDGILFRKEDMVSYDVPPQIMRIIGASDFAATPDGGDWTEHGIGGLTEDGSLFLLDWKRGRVGPEVWIEWQIDMIAKWKPLAWGGESGVIRRATEGLLRRRMIERNVNCRIEWLPPISDKPTMAQAIIALSGSGRVFWPKAAWVAELQRQCLVFPNGQPDDGVDALGKLGIVANMLGKVSNVPTAPPIPVVSPFRRR